LVKEETKAEIEYIFAILTGEEEKL